MNNPYSSINWNTVQKIVSVSHCHTPIDSYYTAEQKQTFFDNVVNGGVRHFAVSNYYRSEPRYPLADYYTDIPSNAIQCPNAEQHGFARFNNRLHVNSIGSFFTSGSLRNRIDGEWIPETPIGVGGASYQTIFPQIFAQLQYADGGGITINHPIWSGLNNDNVIELLDYDDRVLGLEIYNHSCEDINNTGWALDMWDSVLLTGRKCFGFCVPDHEAESSTNWQGRIILLVSEATEHECLKAYREGRFFSKINNTNLNFTNISCDGNTFTVQTENAENINIIINGQTQVINGNSATVSIPSNAVYVRAEAESANDRIFSNAITIKEFEKSGFSSTNFMLLM